MSGDKSSSDQHRLLAEDKVPKFDVETIFGDTVLTKNGSGTELRSPTTLKGKYVGIYFSGHWCPPCRQFTPSLVQSYRAAQRAQHPFEVVFVSSDRHVGAFSEYYADMPWVAVPFGEYALRRKLMETFKVNGIPHLVILGPEGQVINGNARGAIAGDPHGKSFPWAGSTSLNSGLGGVQSFIQTIAWILLLYYLWRIAKSYF